MLLLPVARVYTCKSSCSLLRRAQLACLRRPSSTQVDRKDETIHLAVGGNGQLTLDISAPVKVTKENSVLLHLPTGPLPTLAPSSLWNGAGTGTHLAKFFPEATIIVANYRLGSPVATEDNRFPTPIHDCFKAWEYVIDPDSPHNCSFRNNGSEYLRPRVCLHGTHIGGALALMLALTNPQDIYALAIEEPLVDWVVLDEFVAAASAVALGPQSSRKPKAWLQSPEHLNARAEAARTLIKLRTSLFRTPSGYFDPFASPTLFLRAPGRDTPLTRSAAPALTGEDEFAVFEGEEIRYGEDEDDVGWVETGDGQDAFGPYDDDYHALTAGSNNPARESEILSDEVESSDMAWKDATSLVQSLTDLSFWTSDQVKTKRRGTSRRRKVLRRWPPNMQPEEATLPYVQIYLRDPDSRNASSADHTDLSPVTYAQGAELQELLRRACFWGREKGEAEARVNTTMTTTDDGVFNGEPAFLWLQAKFWQR